VVVSVSWCTALCPQLALADIVLVDSDVRF
jgi:hypothetical protein